MSYRYRNRDFSDFGCLGWCLVVLLVIGLVWLDVWIACWLWGLIAVAIFGLPALSWWQMFGLIWLLRFIMPTGSVRVRD